MNKFLLGTLLAALILGAGCSRNTPSIPAVSELRDQTTTINIVAQVNHLSQKEFERVGTEGIKNPKIDDFRNFVLKVGIINGKSVREKELIVPSTSEFKQILTSKRLWFGNEVNINNDGEEVSIAERNFVLYYRELTDDKLKVLLDPIRFHVGWINSNGDKTSKDYKLVDYLVFK